MSSTETFEYPKDGLFRYRVTLAYMENGQQLAQDYAVRWSPEKVSAAEVGLSCAAEVNARSKNKVMCLSSLRVA